MDGQEVIKRGGSQGTLLTLLAWKSRVRGLNSHQPSRVHRTYNVRVGYRLWPMERGTLPCGEPACLPLASHQAYHPATDRWLAYSDNRLIFIANGFMHPWEDRRAALALPAVSCQEMISNDVKSCRSSIPDFPARTTYDATTT